MNTRKLIAFTGPAGCGKDTAGEWFSQLDDGYTIHKFATPLKKMLAAGGFGYPLTFEQKEAIIPWLGKSWRHLAQTLGTEWGREMIDPTIWTKILEQDLLNDYARNFVITDLRFPNEAEMILRNGGIVVAIEGRKLGTGNDAHKSEQELPDELITFRICNDGTLEEFYEELKIVRSKFNL
jgi:hypothetical protein